MASGMKIVVDSKIPFIEGRFPAGVDVRYLPPSEITQEAVKTADALVVRTRTRCNARLLEGSSVKFVFTATIGTDHIDLDWCGRNGITVKSAVGCNAPGVAQYVWASLLSRGISPENKTVGVVGYGNIGGIVARWGRALGTEVLVNDPPKQSAGHDDEDYISLYDLLKKSDVVTVHTPLALEGEHATHHLIGIPEFEAMKEGAVLINAARGGIVDEAALRRAVVEKHVRPIIDVWENEPLVDPFLLHRAMVATPHIAGYSRQGKERATRMALEALEDFFGMATDKTGLCGDWAEDPVPDAVGILKSYNPTADTTLLRDNPEKFESIRENYNFRNEVLYSVQGS